MVTLTLHIHALILQVNLHHSTAHVGWRVFWDGSVSCVVNDKIVLHTAHNYQLHRLS